MLFVEHLQILGLKMGCSWEDAREAHRTLIKLWHPDRFSADDPRRAEAELRSKALNRAISELRPFLNSSHYAKRVLGQRVRRNHRSSPAVYNDQSLSWAQRSGSFPTLNRQLRKSMIPSHVTLIAKPTPAETPAFERSRSKPSLGSSGRWKTFVGEVQAKLRGTTKPA